MMLEVYMEGWSDGATLSPKRKMDDADYLAGYLAGHTSRRTALGIASKRYGRVPEELANDVLSRADGIVIRTRPERPRLSLVSSQPLRCRSTMANEPDFREDP